MASYTIGQVTERSGFSASTLRFYEQCGLLTPVDRTEAGYRLYDDASLERLRFIARAKDLGCTLEEVAELAELWERDDCGPVQARLHELVTAKLDEGRRRSAELLRLTAQLQTAAAHLGGEPVDGPCGDGCACLRDRSGSGPTGNGAGMSVPVVLGERTDPAIACTLPAEQMPGRAEEWERLVGFVTDRRPLADGAGVRLLLDPAVPLDELAQLVAAEQGCCAFFAFAITVDDRGIALEVRAPDDAADLVTALFGATA